MFDIARQYISALLKIGGKIIFLRVNSFSATFQKQLLNVYTIYDVALQSFFFPIKGQELL